METAILSVLAVMRRLRPVSRSSRTCSTLTAQRGRPRLRLGAGRTRSLGLSPPALASFNDRYCSAGCFDAPTCILPLQPLLLFRFFYVSRVTGLHPTVLTGASIHSHSL